MKAESDISRLHSVAEATLVLLTMDIIIAHDGFWCVSYACLASEYESFLSRLVSRLPSLPLLCACEHSCDLSVHDCYVARLLKALTVLLCFSVFAVITMLLLLSRCPCQRCLRSKARHSLHSLRFSLRLRLGFCQFQPCRCLTLTRSWIRTRRHPPCCCCLCYYYYGKCIIMPVL